MPSDPSTQDLIAAARSRADNLLPDTYVWPTEDVLRALADRLEQTEEERRKIIGRSYRRLRKKYSAGEITTQAFNEAHRAIRYVVDVVEPEPSNPEPDTLRARVTEAPPIELDWTLPGDSPEPSDPEPDRSDEHKRHRDAVRKVAERMYDPEPEIGRTAAEDGDTYNPQWMPPDEDADPEDDPWEEIATWTDVIRALHDLRDRVEGNDDRAYQAVRQNDRKISVVGTRLATLLGEHDRLSDRLTTLETEMRHRVTKVERRMEAVEKPAPMGGIMARLDAMENANRVRHGILSRVVKRLTTLEGHADRGNEAEGELRTRVGRLEYREEAARRTRVNLLNDRDSLAERVERLEALDRATTTVHDNLIEEILGRVEALEADAKVAREMRLKLLGRLSELADGESGEGV